MWVTNFKSTSKKCKVWNSLLDLFTGIHPKKLSPILPEYDRNVVALLEDDAIWLSFISPLDRPTGPKPSQSANDEKLKLSRRAHPSSLIKPNPEQSQ